MRRFEIIVKSVTQAKLTIAKDRTTLKLPEFMHQTERQACTALAKYADSQVPEVEFTLRGRFWDNQIHLTPETSGKGQSYFFKLSDVQNETI
jgi:hypothetical protein